MNLSNYNPVWEEAPRSQKVGTRVYEDESVLIATDFEGGNGADIRRLGNDHYTLRLEPELGENRFKGLAYYVCFGIRSKRSEPRNVRIRLEARVQSWESWQDHKHMVVRRAGQWSHIDPENLHPVENAPDAFEVDLLLPAASEPESTLFVSNFHWWPYSERLEYLKGLSGGARVREIGRSYQDRPIYAVEMGSQAAGVPCIVQSQTTQPSEMMASHTLLGMIDYLNSEDEDALRICKQFRLCFIPVTNPDGSVLGYGVSDAQGRFPHFEAHLAAEGDPMATPENVTVWRYLEEQRPWLFWEWHSNNWFRRPGHVLIGYRPELSTNSAIRAMWEEIDEQLLTLPNTYQEGWTSHTEGSNQDCLGFLAATRLGSISCIIKQHEKYPLTESRNHGIACLKTAVAVFQADLEG